MRKWASVLCLVHCIGMAVITALFGAAGEAFAEQPWWHQMEIVLVTVVLANTVFLLHKVAKREEWRLGGIGVTALAVTMIGFAGERHEVLVPAMLVLAFWQFHAARRTASHSGHCDHGAPRS